MMSDIVEGVRPGKPTFVMTRGYTEEIWQLTMSCWKEDPTERPTVDYALDALESAAGQWVSKGGELAPLSPRDEPKELNPAFDSPSGHHEEEPEPAPAAPKQGKNRGEDAGRPYPEGGRDYSRPIRL